MTRWLALVLAAVAVGAIGVVVGPADLSVAGVVAALRGEGDQLAVGIVRQLRVPRVVLAFIVGGSLGVTGAVLQALVRNPLAEPFLLGLSGGAGLGAVLAIALGWSGLWGVPLAATAGALIAIALVYRLAIVAGGVLDTRVLLFAGVVISSFATAVMGAILALSPAAELRNAMLWMLGGFDRSSWSTVTVFATYSVVPLTLLYAFHRPLDLLSLGEEPAQHLGVDVERLKRALFLLASLLTAAAVAVSGIIGFVGLVVPHGIRAVWGHMHRDLLPGVFLLGGTLMVAADTLARSIVQPVELPVGSVTAIIGVPVFAFLLRKWAN
ncbi:MAG: FecCD family ABC transporter permease [Gemmatimonadales bacterium]